jgi:hypothetical protein
MSAQLKVVAIGNAIPDDEVVDVLRDLLERAKAGEIRSIAFVAGTVDSSTVTGLAGVADRMVTLGHLSRLQYRIHKDMDVDAVHD